ncbi:hypothetical protein [Pedobacter flavus]|uniref:Outer membrane protein beta-barrel domain-containing protein n=1 Tax=Pedobacter flavus TaxID=3113906 RepID=A0ABU7H2K9_9SPHI|nr:hypothetical protein [Pedobacter sp. VNH31]MEE1885468.1 hypothetical protein [Pedobacter sp. VNH31]
MKIFYSILIFACLIPAISEAQNTSNKFYSVGTKAIRLSQMPKLLNQVNNFDYKTTYVDNIFFKVLDNQINYRFSASYFDTNYTFKNQCNTCQEGDGSLKDLAFKFGFEKNVNYSVVQPYYGVDLGYKNNNFNGTIRDMNSATPLQNAEIIKNGLTISPVIGFKFNLNPNVLIFAESSFDFYYNYEQREIVDSSNGALILANKFTRMEYLLNPVSAGIQINFGNKN